MEADRDPPSPSSSPPATPGGAVATDPTLDAGVTGATANPGGDTLPASADASAAARAGLPTRARERYALGAELARGGMGRIVTAVDRELGRELAIKELLGAGAALEARFVREIHITARLHHPSVIAVQEAGRWPDGTPFYTMPRVKGRSLDVAIAEAKTPTARLALLPHVIAVADAMAYAHGERIIHRDLKPGNVLVGRFGETIVIDWGLAKRLDDDDTLISRDAATAADPQLTMMGDALGTPAYMPPEQARGDRADARADVYALGAILYHVLGGRRPYASAARPVDVVDAVVAGPPAPLDDTVPAELRAVVAKAMARAPGDRYPTAAELAADLRRFATGQLVGAHAYTSWQLVRRWLRRHRVVVTIAAAALVAVAVTGGVAVHRVRAQRDAAAAQRALADAHRAEVEELLDFMLVDLGDTLRPLGKLDLLDMVAGKAAAYYAARPVDWAAPDDVRRRGLVDTHLGGVLAARGDLEAALRAYLDADALFARLGARRERARVQQAIGEARAAQGDRDGALAAYREAPALRDALAADADGDAALQLERAGSQARIGELLEGRGDLDGARAAYLAMQALVDGVLSHAPEDASAATMKVQALARLGDLAARRGDARGAIATYEAALTAAEALAARFPDDASRQRLVTLIQDRVGEARAAQGDHAGALTAYRASLAVAQRLAERDPSNLGWQRDLSIGHVAVADELREVGDVAGATASYEAARAIRERLAALDPSNAEWTSDLSIVIERLADLQLEHGDTAAALAGFRRCLALRDGLVARDPDDLARAENAFIARYKVGTALHARGDVAGATRELRAALAAAQTLAAAHPDEPSLAEDVAELRDVLTTCCGGLP
ncbi:MAG: serine/threonine protein kinase [Kofleriaceae bacterium]|nr:serine/threonine protein kinase [Kofleriaceae bacterium]MCB9575040.1 serine/threonine protein kinase [Kofleriaceae bacterium]